MYKRQATNREHGIYVDIANNTRITNNVIWDNADWGVQVYPDAVSTTISHNIIWSFPGERGPIVVGGEAAPVTTGTLIDQNILGGGNANLTVWWGGPTGTNNVVTAHNCLFGTIGGGAGLIVSAGVITTAPGFTDPARGDFSMPASSPCAAYAPA